MITDNKIDRLLGPSGTFAGYSLIVFGLIGLFISLSGLILVVAGMFMAFTYDGTLIDFSTRRIKSYTCLFGFLKIGKWHSINDFNKFRIYKSNRLYSSYSRTNMQLTLKNSDIRLLFLNKDGSLKITVNKYGSFKAARKGMSELIRDLQITELKEWI
jgi:hypothetical protein